MVNSLLDISRMEAGQLPLNLAECNVAEIISEVLGKLGPLKAKRRIIVDMPESLRVTADRNLIVRLIQNLTDNAFGFTPEDGQVCIGAQRQKDHIRVFVADNGLGIPSEYQERIFEKFGQVEARKNGRKYSTGLGLTFCKLAVEAHGGRIGVDSEVGKGSTFWFELPRVAGQPGSRE
jgi:signal transduction histidine kinase